LHHTQTHDFDLGIDPFPSGIFWTTRIPSHDVRVDQEGGTASLRVKRLKCPDYFSIGNALANGPSVPAETTFDVQWFGPSTPASWHTTDFTFEGMQSRASFTWSAKEAGATWTSDSAGQIVESAFLGTERNGVFLSQAGGDDDHQD
jgi:hypothetical protein